MKEETFNVRGAVFLAEYGHKHGTDHSIHITLEGAVAWCYGIIQEFKADYLYHDDTWKDEPVSSLYDKWPEISGGTEYFSITPLDLNK